MKEFNPYSNLCKVGSTTLKIDSELEKSKGSPFYRRYVEIQNQYSDCIVAYRVGDFYEVIGENAIIVSNILNLTLSGRDCGLESRVPMVGFPFHLSVMYVGMLAEKGYKVAVFD